MKNPTTISDILEKFDKKKLGQLDWCGNEDHECNCTVKEKEIKQFIRQLIEQILEEFEDTFCWIDIIPSGHKRDDLYDYFNKIKQ